MPEIFTDITSSISGAAVFATRRDCLLFGFDEAVVKSASPPNTINLNFSTRAIVDCKLIVEYSAGDGVWKPLGYSDTTDGASANGVLHFEPPNDWAKTLSWDGVTNIGGAGSTPLYWVRVQRREGDSANTGAVLSTVAASNRPYAVAKRSTDTLYLEYSQEQVGQVVYFRFVPVGRDGRQYPEQDVKYSHQIKGFALNPGNAT